MALHNHLLSVYSSSTNLGEGRHVHLVFNCRPGLDTDSQFVQLMYYFLWGFLAGGAGTPVWKQKVVSCLFGDPVRLTQVVFLFRRWSNWWSLTAGAMSRAATAKSQEAAVEGHCVLAVLVLRFTWHLSPAPDMWVYEWTYCHGVPLSKVRQLHWQNRDGVVAAPRWWEHLQIRLKVPSLGEPS
jgi:hypothetical protein